MRLKVRSAGAAVAAVLLALAAVEAAAQRRGPRARVGVEFAAGRASLGVPFDLAGNLIFVRATVNDSAPLWFILDTGASSTVVNTGEAARLGLRGRGRVVGRGAGGTAVATRLGRVKLGLPGAAVTNLPLHALDLDFLSPPFARPVGGVIGNDVIGRFVVEIDYARRLLNFRDPRGYEYAGAAAALPLSIQDGLPFVRARVVAAGGPPLEGLFEIDTGSTGAILFNTHFARKHGLAERLRPRSKAIRLGGVGGTADAMISRVESVTLGRHTLRGVLARISFAAEGDYASRRYDGLLGGEIFRRFRLTVDLARRRAYFEPDAAALAEPFEDDMSGVELMGDGDDFKTYVVNDVEAGSPAAEAGVREEDVLTAIDGRPAAEFSLEEVRRMFTREGHEYTLTLLRDGRPVEVRLRLRRLV